MVRLIVGIVLMVLAFVELFLFIGGPENKLVADVMTSVICQRGERFTQVLGGYVYGSEGGGQSFTFYCNDEAGNQRDVTGEGVLIGILGYVAPFILGLLLVILGPIGMARGRRNAATVGSGVGFTTGKASSSTTDPFGNPINVGDFQSFSSGQQVSSATVFTVDGKQVNMGDLPPEMVERMQQAVKQVNMGNLSPEMAQRIQDALGRLGTMMENGNFVMQGGDLTHKLEQLKEARDKNLITEEEYQRLRKAILDHLGAE